MFELLFGNQNTEKIFFFLLRKEKCYANELAECFDTALFGIQNALQKLEKAGVLVSIKQRNIRMYQFNPQYPFLKELKIFLEKAYLFLPKEVKEKYYEQILRTRPRRTGKPFTIK